MECPKCGCEGYITASSLKVEGDNSPDVKTTITRVIEISCKNPKCQNQNKVFGTTEHTLYG